MVVRSALGDHVRDQPQATPIRPPGRFPQFVATVPCSVLWPSGWRAAFQFVDEVEIHTVRAMIPTVTPIGAWDASMRVALPAGLAFFIAEKSFSHGGDALQEILIPHLVSRMATQEKRVGIEVLVPAAELVRASVTVVLRPKGAGWCRSDEPLRRVGPDSSAIIDVLRVTSSGEQTSVLATGRPKDVRIDGGSGDVTENLFFTPRSSFRRGDVLELNVRDPETFETFPPGGIKLTVGRDMCNKMRIPRHVDQRSEMMSISIPKWCRSAFRTEADQFYSCSSEQ